MYARTVLSISVLAALSAPAQNIGGSISGQVLDSQGLAIEAVRLEATNLTTGAKQQTLTDRSGRFVLPSLPQSLYRVTADKQGFAIATADDVKVAIGESPNVRLTLAPAAAAQTVTVNAEVSALPTGTPERGSSYNAALMNDLPMLGGGTGRNFRTQAYLTPGVSLSTAAHRPFAVSGSRNRNNNYLVDSNDFNEAEGGLLMGRGTSEQLISTEAIDGMQVLTHNFKAEHGRQNGSVVSLITKRGGNNFHGLAYNYLRNEKLDTRNTFDAARPPLR
jgi:Carboxypeptidase regulatory-like domain